MIDSIIRGVTKIPRRLSYEVAGLVYHPTVAFIIVGVQKSGTSALYHFLKQHPDISMSLIKETNFF